MGRHGYVESDQMDNKSYGTWWDRVGKCPLYMNTHAETTSTLASQGITVEAAQ